MLLGAGREKERGRERRGGRRFLPWKPKEEEKKGGGGGKKTHPHSVLPPEERLRKGKKMGKRVRHCRRREEGKGWRREKPLLPQARKKEGGEGTLPFRSMEG